MGSDNAAGQAVNSGANRFALNTAIGNPLQFGGSNFARKVADPLGLFSKKEKKPFVYEEGKIYGNPEKAERARQITIQRGTERVNTIFDDPAREAQRASFLQAIRDFYTQDANKQKGVADRNLRFSMARGGLTGGSANVDANRQLGEEYTKGLLDAENKAQGAYSDLQAQDEQARLNLLGMVRSGMDTGTAAARSAAAIQQNAAGAKSDALAQGLGDIFGSTSGTYKAQQEAAARRRGILESYGSFYGAKNPYQ